MNGKQRFLATIRGEVPDRAPVFPLLMAFSAKRLGVSYRAFASDGQVLAEAQHKAWQMFGMDAVTACSDAFRVSADLGGDIIFPEDKPPHLARPLVTADADLNRLKRPDPADAKTRMADRVRGVAGLARSVGRECMVLGWVDMPFAEACSLCGVTEFMVMLADDPGLAHRILSFLTDIVIDFAVAQTQAGAPMVGAGDAAASLISPAMYREFALPYEQRVCDAIHSAGGSVKLHICGNTSKLLEDMAQSGADLFNVDHMVDLQRAKEVYGKAGKAFKGNLDPVTGLLFSTPEECAGKAAELLEQMKGARYMLSPGCEVPADVSDEVFQAFCSQR